jgi:glyoxylase-like metal-dependent hydrolase (beta-lactamase superfamily II)
MKQIFPDLWQTRAEHPFAGVTSHAYLFVRDTGNILLYSSGLRDEYQHIKELGGIAHQYLSHRDEAGPALAEIKELFGSKLWCHRLEEPSIRKFAPVDSLFDKREVLNGIEVIPTPGHTDGSVCFLIRSAHGKTYLFTGDTIYQENGAWETRANGYAGGSKSELKNSLMLLRDLVPAVVLSSASVGSVPFKEVSTEEWQSDVDNVVRTLSSPIPRVLRSLMKPSRKTHD